MQTQQQNLSELSQNYADLIHRIFLMSDIEQIEAALTKITQLPQSQLIALFAYKKCVRLNPRFVKGLHLLGIISHNMGDSQRALEYLKKAHELSPANLAILKDFAAIYRAIGKANEAMNLYALSLQKSPDNTDILLCVASLAIQVNEPERAQKVLQYILSLNPNHDEARKMSETLAACES